MALNLPSLISMGTQAAQMLGKGGVVVDMVGKLTSVWQEYKKYPQTPEGLRQAMQAHNVDATTIRNALQNMPPKWRQFIDQKFPGSLSLLSNMCNGQTPSSPEAHQSSHSPRVQELLNRARRR